MKMLGPLTNQCPYGKHCTDNPTPGKARTQARRTQRRRENQAVRREVRLDADRD